MKVMTVLGTRPELIRLSLIIKKLDKAVDHIFVHTGQNFDANLSDIFFKQLEIRQPDYSLNVQSSSFGEQAGKIIAECDRLLEQEKPDKILILGDTNSGLAAIPAKRKQVGVYHMEAGNRCFDDRVPEEINRRIIDHSSDVLMPYTERSRANLLAEGIPGQRIFVTGNPILEVLQHYEDKSKQSDVLKTLGLEPQKYFLVTVHRAENVDSAERFSLLLNAFKRIHDTYRIPVIISTHPRTRSKLKEFHADQEFKGLQFLDPFGFFDFVSLEKQAFCVITDSGTVQEECSIFRVPNVTVRDTTERPETLECGSNIITGVEPADILPAVQSATASQARWQAPPEYLRDNVSDVVLNLLLSRPAI